MSDDLATWLLEAIDWTVDTVARRLYEVDREAALLVMAEGDAKRQAITECLESIDTYDGDFDQQPGADVAKAILRILALPYADLPGYRTEWKP